jgi:hypothetical protein
MLPDCSALDDPGRIEEEGVFKDEVQPAGSCVGAVLCPIMQLLYLCNCCI